MALNYEVRGAISHVRSVPSGDSVVLTGLAALYRTLSEDLGGFRERLMPGAFTRALKAGQDVRHLINHDPSLLLGRTKSGTTVLEDDPDLGLRFRTTLPNTTYAKNLIQSVQRGDIRECSFGFSCVKDSWIREGDPRTGEIGEIRELHDVDLFDISTVTYPAYSGTNTEIAQRSRRRFLRANEKLPFRLTEIPTGPVELSAAEQRERNDWRRWADRRLSNAWQA